MALALVALVVIAGVILRQRDGGGGAKPPSETKLSGTQAMIFGRVTDARTKAAVAGAKIAVKHARGAFEVSGDSSGKYQAVVDSSQPVGFTVDAAGHQGAAVIVKLCAGERRDAPVALAPADDPQAPPPPMFLPTKCR